MHQPDLKTDVFSPLKLFTHMDVMYDWWQGKNVYPITMELSPSTICNHFCTWCMHGGYFGSHKGDDKSKKANPDASIMPLSFYRTLLDELVTLGTKSMIFSGSGEPFVNPNLMEFVEYTAHKGVDSAIITHGGLLTPEKAKVVARHCTWIRISLNAGTPETREKIHKVNDFEKVLGNLANLVEEKRRQGSKVQIGAQISVEPTNIAEIEEATRRVRETGIDYFQIKPVILHPKSSSEFYDRDFYLDALYRGRAARQMYETETFRVFVKEDQFAGVLAPDLERSAYRKCYATFFPVIEANKKVYYCSQTRGQEEFCLGDLSTQSFKEIWESERRQQVIASINVDQCQPICRCHPINKVLWTLRHPGNNPNFV
ncbi:radical SAM/SPASM domain-containing protein [Chloracidobacterium thermophilum]|uniref:radical SAM protein n=1 Tax=Chloracidobacterium thermophilum TaxID=458033 RepID=UPI0007388C85|nr:radical SAM/SPASM domain-containing protein [Chloracidobacterium thermophilum]